MNDSTRNPNAGRAASIPLAFAFVSVVTFLVYMPTLSNNAFVWDDDANFVENHAYRGLGMEQLRWMATTFHLGPYQPLSWLTLGLDYVFWGMHPFGYHLTNVLLHSLGAGMLLLVSMRWHGVATSIQQRDSQFTVPVSQFSQSAIRNPKLAMPSIAFAAFVALYWSLHPMRIEAVSWATERREVLSGLLMLCTLHAAIVGRNRWLIALFAAAAMLAKGTAVTLLPLLILLNVWRGSARDMGGMLAAAIRSALRHFPVVLCAIVIAGVAVLGQRHAGAMQSLENVTVTDRLLLFFNSIWFYLHKSLWPMHLLPMYEPPQPLTKLAPQAACGWVLTMAALWLGWRWRTRLPALLFLTLAYLALLLPVGGMIQVGGHATADRYSYPIGMVLSVAIIMGGAALMRRIGLPRLVAGIAGGLACGALSAAAIEQQGVWKDNASLWKYQISIAPDTAIAQLQLGLLYVEEKLPGGDAAAEPHFRKAVHALPGYADAWCALADLFDRTGRPEDARTAVDNALKVSPNHKSGLFRLANLLWREGKKEEALARLKELERADQHSAKPLILLGRALAALGDVTAANAADERAIQLEPDNVMAYTDLAWRLATHPDAAARDGKRAVALAEQALKRFGPDHANILQALLAAYAETGDFDSALATAQLTIARFPNSEGEMESIMAQLEKREPIRAAPTYP